ncbi:MAG TPA: glycerol-3-phosphate 1-O-acyltransferase PlsY [Clostridia bacterium]|nr:glycerol-3-phosphate 1-O-acyltransferase PlsY [Clostridia bacterium]
MLTALILAACYFLGSIPFGYVLGKNKGVDLRKEGSGNIGATNAMRVMGYKAGLAVLALDAFKGFLGAYLGGLTGVPDAWGEGVGGLLAFMGHCFPVFLGFRGGKGVATALGVMLYLVPVYAVFALGTYAATVLVSKYSSLGTLVSLALISVLMLTRSTVTSYKTITVLMAAIIVFKHRGNIERLIRGEELPIIRKKTKNVDGGGRHTGPQRWR